MKKRKKLNLKTILISFTIFALGIITSGLTITYAATVLSGSSVHYDNTKSGGSSSNVSGALDELYAVAEDQDVLMAKIIDRIYPIGSIYMSTEDDTVEKVQAKFGGTWEKYAEDMTLVGASSSKSVNSTGGSSTVTLSTSNLPSHSHSFTPAGKVSSSFSGKSVNTSSTNTNHRHSFSSSTGDGITHTTFYLYRGGSASSVIGTYDIVAGTDGGGAFGSYPTGSNNVKGAALNHYHNFSGTTGTMDSNASHYHSVTASGSVSSSFTGTASNTGKTGSTSSFSVQNPYIAVYMYKRVS